MRNRRWIKRVLILFFLRHLQPRIFWGLTNQGNRRPPRREAPPVGVRVDRVVRPRGHQRGPLFQQIRRVLLPGEAERRVQLSQVPELAPDEPILQRYAEAL